MSMPASTDKTIRPLILNTSDVQGGAAIATHRLLIALRREGVSAEMAVQVRAGDTEGIHAPQSPIERLGAWWRPRRDRLRLRSYPSRTDTLFSPNLVHNPLRKLMRRIRPDVIHLSWVNRAFLGPGDIASFRRPLIWTLHDMWPFTGGCHYDNGCGRFTAQCGRCPALGSDEDRDISRLVWQTKRAAWQEREFIVISPSGWLAKEAARSSLFGNSRIVVVPNCIDTDVYRPVSKQFSRFALGLPQGAKLVLMGAENAASDPRKGFDLLAQAIRRLSAKGSGADVALVVLGASRSERDQELNVPIHYLGRLHDDVSKVLAYSAADVVVAPSRQENLSNTVMESLACGTPVAAFAIGGMSDLVSHEATGYLARPFATEDLAHGIQWILRDTDRLQAMSEAARAHVVANYSPPLIAHRHMEIYGEAIARHGK